MLLNQPATNGVIDNKRRPPDVLIAFLGGLPAQRCTKTGGEINDVVVQLYVECVVVPAKGVETIHGTVSTVCAFEAADSHFAVQRRKTVNILPVVPSPAVVPKVPFIDGRIAQHVVT